MSTAVLHWVINNSTLGLDLGFKIMVNKLFRLVMILSPVVKKHHTNRYS